MEQEFLDSPFSDMEEQQYAAKTSKSKSKAPVLSKNINATKMSAPSKSFTPPKNASPPAARKKKASKMETQTEPARSNFSEDYEESFQKKGGFSAPLRKGPDLSAPPTPPPPPRESHESSAPPDPRNSSNSSSALNNTIPQNFKQIAQQAYQKLIQSGEGKSWNRSRLMLVGEGRAGKTSTLRCLMGKAFDPLERSTVGFSTDVCQVDRTNIKGWKECEDTGTEYDKALADLTAAAMSSAKGGASGAGGASAEQAAAGGADSGEAPKEAVEAEAAVARLDADLVLQAMNDQKNDSIVLSTWDYAGQRVFYAVHHLFLTKYGVYLVVFDMQKFLNPKTVEETMEYLNFWLNSIFIHANGAAVLLVGTHRDKVFHRAKHEEISRQLLIHFSSSPCFQNVVNNDKNRLAFFPVDNSRKLADSGVDELSGTVLECANKSEFVKKKVPLVWLKLFDELQKLTMPSKAPNGAIKQFLNIDEVYPIAQQCGMPSMPTFELEDEVEDALALFHQMGQLIHYSDDPLRHLVVLDPQWLVDVVTMIIRDYSNDLHRLPIDREARQCHKEWEDLAKRGVLAATLLSVFWSHYTVKERCTFAYLMEKFSLMVPFRKRAQKSDKVDDEPQKYLVPSLLPPLDIKSNNKKGEANPACYFVFGRKHSEENNSLLNIDEISDGFLPEGLFSRLLAKLLIWTQETFGFAELYSNHADVSFGEMRFQCTLEPTKHRVRVEIFVENAEAVVQRLSHSLDRVIAECMPSLKYDVFVCAPKHPNYVVELKQLRSVAAAHGNIWLDKKPINLSQFEVWLPQQGLLNSYDIFISYRSATDTEFAMKLFDCFGKFAVGPNGRRLRVFYDKVRLEDGRRWDRDFMQALSSSLVIVPIVSPGALSQMRRLEKDPKKVDNVLLEWQLAMELADAGKVKKIVPILLGEIAPAATESPHGMTNLLTSAVRSSLPKTHAEGTYATVVDFLGQLNVKPNPNLAGLGVHDVVDNLLKYQAVRGWWVLSQITGDSVGEDDMPATGGLWGLHEYCAEHISHLTKAITALEPADAASAPAASTPEVDEVPTLKLHRAISKNSYASVKLPDSSKLMVFVTSLDAGEPVYAELRALGVQTLDDLAYLRPKEIKALKKNMKVVAQRKFDGAVITAKEKVGAKEAKTAACCVM